MDLPNGTYTTYTYNDRNRLTAIAHKKSDDSTFLSLSYEYDDCGNTTKCTENNGDVTDFSYDALYRLTRETKKDDEEEVLYDYSYEYDAVGNRTKKTDEETQTETDYTYNDMNQMTTAGNITYSYDDAGNMASKVVNEETTTYVSDFHNKLVKVDFPTGDDLAMRYDGEGTRVSKVVGSTTTKCLYDGSSGLPPFPLFETDGSGSARAEFRRDGVGNVLAVEQSGVPHWYHVDRLGSTRALTNASETVTDTYTYDAWGSVAASSGSTPNPFRYVGQLGYYDDSDAGLMLLWARYYDTDAGRFAAADPLKDGTNCYVYAGDCPTVQVDPAGLKRTFAGCSNKQRSRLNRHLDDICKNRLGRTGPQIGGCLQRRCNDVVIHCPTMADQWCAKGWCGYVPQNKIPSTTIYVCPTGFSRGTCGCLGKTIAHELAHSCGDRNEPGPRQCEWDMYGPGAPPCPPG
jgi:RHS repeat-associated protein